MSASAAPRAGELHTSPQALMLQRQQACCLHFSFLQGLHCCRLHTCHMLSYAGCTGSRSNRFAWQASAAQCKSCWLMGSDMVRCCRQQAFTVLHAFRWRDDDDRDIEPELKVNKRRRASPGFEPRTRASPPFEPRSRGSPGFEPNPRGPMRHSPSMSPPFREPLMHR